MAETIRAFIACPLPPDIRCRLAAAQTRLAQTGADVKWVAADNLHLTLRFLGDRPAKRLQVIRKKFTGAFDHVAAIPTSVDHAGAFPLHRSPRVVWAGLRHNAVAILQLAAQVEALVNRCGLPKSRQPFHPHITLGRVRGQPTGDTLRRALQDNPFPQPLPFTVDTLHLYQSRLSNREPVYEILESVQLKNA